MRRLFCILTLCMLVSVLMGCATLPTVTKISTAPEAEKVQFAQKNFTYSVAHKQWAGVEEGKGKTVKAFAKPKHDPAELRKIKTVAIVSFDFNLLRAEEAKSRNQLVALAQVLEEQAKVKKEMGPFNKYVDEMYSTLAQNLTKYGYTVIPVEQVKNCPYYQQLEFKEAEGKTKGAWGGGWKVTLQGNDLKQIEAVKLTKSMAFPVTKQIQTITEKVTQMQELAKALGADAVILVDNATVVQVKWGKAKMRFGNKKGPVPGLTLDMFSAAEPRLIWSTSLKGEIGVPTEVKSTTVLLLGTGFPPLEKYGPDFVATYKDLSELAVLRLVQDSK